MKIRIFCFITVIALGVSSVGCGARRFTGNFKPGHFPYELKVTHHKERERKFESNMVIKDDRVIIFIREDGTDVVQTRVLIVRRLDNWHFTLEEENGRISFTGKDGDLEGQFIIKWTKPFPEEFLKDLTRMLARIAAEDQFDALAYFEFKHDSAVDACAKFPDLAECRQLSSVYGGYIGVVGEEVDEIRDRFFKGYDSLVRSDSALKYRHRIMLDIGAKADRAKWTNLNEPRRSVIKRIIASRRAIMLKELAKLEYKRDLKKAFKQDRVPPGKIEGVGAAVVEVYEDIPKDSKVMKMEMENPEMSLPQEQGNIDAIIDEYNRENSTDITAESPVRRGEDVKDHTDADAVKIIWRALKGEADMKAARTAWTVLMNNLRKAAAKLGGRVVETPPTK